MLLTVSKAGPSNVGLVPIGSTQKQATDDAQGNQARSYTMNTLFNRFLKDESGATAIEYGLIAALISVGIIAALKTVGTNLSTTFSSVSNNLSGAAAP
jgi:pilus assembly protein Flp/PilA